MASLTNFVRLVLLAVFFLAAGNAAAQDELRKTFFKEVDAALAAADAANAELLAPNAYECNDHFQFSQYNPLLCDFVNEISFALKNMRLIKI